MVGPLVLAVRNRDMVSPRRGRGKGNLGRRSTPAGEHRPVLLEEVLRALGPLEGAAVVDATVGWAGHAAELLRRVGPGGRLIGLDLDAENLPRARERLEAVGGRFALHHSNFAALPAVLAAEGVEAADAVLADLGMSSMQVDDAERGFSYARDGPLDMRMDRSRGRSAAQVLAAISEEELARALREYGDEPEAERVAARIVAARGEGRLERTADLARLLLEGAGRWRLHPAPGRWNLHPAARTFQALRILVNRERGNLEQLLRVLPEVLRPGGRAAVISFHSGEDRLVKAAFRDGLRQGVYEAAADEAVRPGPDERLSNPRSRSAKLRWARRT
jgi:16S rRNA (cytosine1402-N4)-methyltransferase